MSVKKKKVLAKAARISYNYADIEIHTESDGRLVSAKGVLTVRRGLRRKKTGGLK